MGQACLHYIGADGNARTAEAAQTDSGAHTRYVVRAQELTEARALAEAAQRKADKLVAVARKAAGEVHAARALADAEHAMAAAERSEKAEFKAAKERVRPYHLYRFPYAAISLPGESNG